MVWEIIEFISCLYLQCISCLRDLLTEVFKYIFKGDSGHDKMYLYIFPNLMNKDF